MPASAPGGTPLRLGAVADDVTGACDLAGRVAEAGLAAAVLLGESDEGPAFPDDGAGCAVVALKIRTSPVAEAVAAAGTAARFLAGRGASLLYQKYCSTFDSTAEGNIGPIADALAAVAGADLTVGTPATPAAGRTQYAGVLFADGVPLAESPMRDHPLTPMRDSNVIRLLQPQTPAPVALARWEDVQRGPEALAAGFGTGHTLVDALTDTDLDTLASAIHLTAGSRRLVAGGGAGVATALARAATAGAAPAVALPSVPVTGRLILAGSASAASRAQTAAFPGERHRLDPLALAEDDRELARLRDAVARRPDRRTPVLIHSSGDVARAQQELGAETAAALVEQALAELAVLAVHELGYSHLIVAGGETSGAVTGRLGISRLLVGEQAAPGVPWTVARSGERTAALLLKSGNFGGRGLFTTAWEVAP